MPIPASDFKNEKNVPPFASCCLRHAGMGATPSAVGWGGVRWACSLAVLPAALVACPGGLARWPTTTGGVR